MTRLGDLRIRVVADDDFNADEEWTDSPDLLKDTWTNLANGTWTAYVLVIERAVIGGTGWNEVTSLCGSIHTSGFEGTYTDAVEITDESLRTMCTSLMKEAGRSPRPITLDSHLHTLRETSYRISVDHTGTRCYGIELFHKRCGNGFHDAKPEDTLLDLCAAALSHITDECPVTNTAASH